MNNDGRPSLDKTKRLIFHEVLKVLMPAHLGLPSGGDLDLEGEPLDRVLEVRPEWREGLIKALDQLREAGVSDASLSKLMELGGPSYEALAGAVKGVYYTHKPVWDIIGYPGQQYLPVDNNPTPQYLVDRLLTPVLRRGSIYRDTRGKIG